MNVDIGNQKHKTSPPSNTTPGSWMNGLVYWNCHTLQKSNWLPLGFPWDLASGSCMKHSFYDSHAAVIIDPHTTSHCILTGHHHW